MLKKRKIIISFLTVFAVLFTTGTVFAMVITDTATKKTLSMTSLNVELMREINGKEITEDEEYDITGKDLDVDEKVYAVNSGNADIYVRIETDIKWEDGQDDVFTEIDSLNKDDWIFDKTDNKIFAYYKKKLISGEKTSSAVDRISILKNIKKNTNEFADKKINIKFYAQAVQTIEAEKVIEKEWGVKAKFDKNGNITNIIHRTGNN